MPEKFNELLLKQDIIELYNAGITPDYGYLMNGRFEKDMIKTPDPLKTLSGNPRTSGLQAGHSRILPDHRQPAVDKSCGI